MQLFLVKYYVGCQIIYLSAISIRRNFHPKIAIQYMNINKVRKYKQHILPLFATTNINVY